jgi:DNA end-binding protein Ku
LPHAPDGARVRLGSPSDAGFAVAKAIIAQRTGSFDPTRSRDRYQEALRELIQAKMKGLTVKPRGIAARPPVIDLMVA